MWPWDSGQDRRDDQGWGLGPFLFAFRSRLASLVTAGRKGDSVGSARIKNLIAGALIIAGAITGAAHAGEGEDYSLMLLTADLVCPGLAVPTEMVGTTILIAAGEMGLDRHNAAVQLGFTAAMMEADFKEASRGERESFCSNVSNVIERWEAMK